MKSYIKYSLLFAALAIATVSCKKDLNITNKNDPSIDVLSGETGVTNFAAGGIYIAGFGDETHNYVSTVDDQLGIGFMMLVIGNHEALGDNIYIPWGNNSFKFNDNPISWTLDNGTVVSNPIGGGQIVELRKRNDRAYGAGNAFLPEWTYMYFLNNSTNILLSKLDNTTFSGDATTKKNLLKAWAYWWKGYAYSRIGSMYTAGVITDVPNQTNGNFVDHTAIIAEANKNLDKATELLKTITVGDAYTKVLTQIIPDYIKVGKGKIPTPDMWMRSINTLEARNMLVNKKTKDMTSADWTAVLNLATNGLQANDNVFMIRTIDDNQKCIVDKDGNLGGSTANVYTATENGSTFFASERMIQDFETGDQRFTNNFKLRGSPIVNKRGRGLSFGTRYYLVGFDPSDPSTTPIPGVIKYCEIAPYGNQDYYLAGTYEENELMIAEALINTGQIDQGLTHVDAVRDYEGSGLTHVSGTGLTLAQAKEELRRERRIGLYLRGLAFYDARRWGVIDDVSKGGGRTGAVVLSNGPSNTGGGTFINTNATINYNYLNYWDVPKNELVFNPPASGSAPVISPQ
jgi:hypothetical protein